MLVAQSCPTLCHPVDHSPPGSSVHGSLQARLLEWVAIPFSRGIFPSRDQTWSPTLEADTLPSEPQGKPLYMFNTLGIYYSANFKVIEWDFEESVTHK